MSLLTFGTKGRFCEGTFYEGITRLQSKWLINSNVVKGRYILSKISSKTIITCNIRSAGYNIRLSTFKSENIESISYSDYFKNLKGYKCNEASTVFVSVSYFAISYIAIDDCRHSEPASDIYIGENKVVSTQHQASKRIKLAATQIDELVRVYIRVPEALNR